jgi:hypothetical protein
MAERDAVGLAAFDHGTEEGEAEASGSLFEVAGAGDGSIHNRAGQTEAPREVGYELSIAIGLGAAKPVVNVEHARGKAEIVEQVEQAYGIRPAGDGDSDSPSGGKHAVAFESRCELDAFIVRLPKLTRHDYFLV